MDGGVPVVEEQSGIEERENVEARHKRERKELLATIQKLKHQVKGDKRLKKETTEKIAKMEVEMASRHDEELQQLESLKGDFLHLAVEPTAAEVSAQKKIAKKQEKAKLKEERLQREARKRQERILHQEEENLKGARHKEQICLKEKLAERNLQIFEIPSDGNCLYNAISHQLNLVMPDKAMSVTKLREKTAEYMLSQPDEFLPFLTKPNSHEPYTPEEFEKYCRDICTTSVWGGQPELRALSCVLGTPIAVVQANCDDITIGDQPATLPLTVVYHRHVYSLGEHYNSVTSLTHENHDDDFIVK